MCFPGELERGERNAAPPAFVHGLRRLSLRVSKWGRALPGQKGRLSNVLAPAMIATPEDAPRRLAPASMSAIASS